MNPQNQPVNPNLQPMMEPVKKCKHMPIIIILAILTIGGLGFGGFEFWQNIQKDSALNDYKNQISEKDQIISSLSAGSSNNEDIESQIGSLYLVGNDYTKRRYYFATEDLDPSKDSRDINTYLIDTNMLGRADGIVEYDIKTVLDKIANQKIDSLPDVLAEGTTNARPKSSCKTFKVRIGDITNNPKNIDWTVGEDWSNSIPITVYMECVVDDGNTISQSLGTELYSLNPKTNDFRKVIENWY